MQNRIRFMFIRNSKGHPVGCMAYRVNPGISDFDRALRGTIEFEVSTHNPLDPFDRALGRSIAEGRLMKHPMVLAQSENDPLYDAMLHMLSNEAVPERLKRAIKRNHLDQYE